MRLIDADKLKFSSVVTVGADGIPVLSKEEYISKSEIDAQPTVDAEPIRHGKWKTANGNGQTFYECPNCDYIGWTHSFRFPKRCCECGAIMDGKEEKK